MCCKLRLMAIFLEFRVNNGSTLYIKKARLKTCNDVAGHFTDSLEQPACRIVLQWTSW